MKIPSHYLPLMPYLILTDARAFTSFATTVFGATEQQIVPAADNKIMHGELRIHDAVVMFADATDTWQEKTAAMYMYVPDVNNTYHAALSQGAKTLHLPEQKEYGYTAGFADPFGNHWFIVEPQKE